MHIQVHIQFSFHSLENVITDHIPCQNAGPGRLGGEVYMPAAPLVFGEKTERNLTFYQGRAHDDREGTLIGRSADTVWSHQGYHGYSTYTQRAFQSLEVQLRK